jgi:hypothetical protein
MGKTSVEPSQKLVGTTATWGIRTRSTFSTRRFILIIPLLVLTLFACTTAPHLLLWPWLERPLLMFKKAIYISVIANPVRDF